jgi:predicted nucleic acid-binding Zn ribbon protein
MAERQYRTLNEQSRALRRQRRRERRLNRLKLFGALVLLALLIYYVVSAVLSAYETPGL